MAEYTKNKLDLDDDPDDNTRRLVKLHDEMLAWGGDKGSVYNINSSKEINHWKDDSEEIRAFAVSDDSTCIMIGFDTGSTLIFKYNKDEIKKGKSHPFCQESQHGLPGPGFAASIRDIQFYPGSSTIVAIASEEGFYLYDIEKKEKYLEDECNEYHDSGGVRGVAFSSTGTLASLAMDGRLCLWKPNPWKLFIRENGKCITKNDKGEMNGADAWDPACLPLFMKDDLLILPGETYLQLRDADGTKYDQVNTTTSDDENTKGHIETIVALTTIDDDFLVSTGRDKRVILWEIQKPDGKYHAEFIKQLVELDSAPTDAYFHKDRLLIACADGQLCTFDKDSIIPAEIASKSKISNNKDNHASDEVAESEEAEDAGDSESSKKIVDKAVEKINLAKDDLSSDDDDDGDDNNDDFDHDSSKTKPSTKPIKRIQKKAVDNGASELSDDEDFGESQTKQNRFIDDEAADEDSSTGSPGKASQTSSPAKGGSSPSKDLGLSTSPNKDDDSDTGDNLGTDDHMDDDMDQRFSSRAAKYVELPEPQPAFAPSSSPLELPRRYLCWNHVGSVVLRQDDSGTGRRSVDINFTDSGFRRPVGFTDNLGFILGALGEDGGIFATDLNEDDEDDDNDDLLDGAIPGLSEKTRQAVKRSQRKKGDPNKPTGSSIFFYRFETFASLREKDWYLTLPSGERALGCATGTGWAAVITSRRFLRLFSSGGNQGQVFWLEGEPVTLVGRSRFVAAFYHESEPLRDGTQKIGFKVIDAVSNQIVAKGSLSCISEGASLTWVGFSNDGSLLAMDSAGMMSMLVSLGERGDTSKWEWMPILDTLGLRKSSEDSYWPVTVHDGKLICVPLKGGTKHPDAIRRPVTTSLGMRVPLARGTLAKVNPLEELSIRAGIALGQKRIMQEISSEGKQDEEFEREYQALSAQVDKVTLKIFAATVEAGKLERALDIVDRLHLEKSFELAMTIADNHRKLVDLIEEVKERKFGLIDDGDDYNDTTEFTEVEDHPRISPDSVRKGKRPFDNMEHRNVRAKQSFVH